MENHGYADVPQVKIRPVRARVGGKVYDLKPDVQQMPPGTVTVSVLAADEFGTYELVARDANGNEATVFVPASVTAWCGGSD